MRRSYFFGVAMSVMLVCMLYLYQSFLMNFLVAVLLCIATFGVKTFFDRYLKSNFLSSFFSVFFLLLFLILPLIFLLQQAGVFFGSMTSQKLESYLNASKAGIGELVAKIPFLQNAFEEFSSKLSTQSLVNFGLQVSSYVGKESLQFLLDMSFIVVFLFFLFYYGRRAYLGLLRTIPFGLHQSHSIFEEVSGVLKIVLFSSLINVVLQGLAFGLLMFYYDYSNSLLLGVFYGIAALVPLVGGAIVWIPVVGYELYLGDVKDALVIALYAIVFIGFVIDNVIKPLIIGILNKKVLTKPLKLNEMIIFFAIFAGFSSFGFWGIVIGPAITACFISLLRLYRGRFFRKDAGAI